MSKKIIAISAAIILAAIAVVGGTLAWFTAEDTATNVLTTGSVEVTLKEQVDDGEGTKDVAANVGLTLSDIMPGDEITKRPFLVLGEDSENAYVRMKFTVESTATGVNQETIEQKIIDLFAAKIDKTNWKQATDETDYDDWYYYMGELSSTNPLHFTTAGKLVFNGNEFTDIYQGITFTIKFDAAAVQVANQEPTSGTITADYLDALTSWPD